jgi:ABC-2 type transport system permease protein
MSWLVVAKKDLQDAGRSRLLWVLTALFVLLVGGLAYAYTTVIAGDDAGGSLGFVVFLQGVAAFFVSITALLVAYKAIAGERESGTLNFLLGLPVRRRDVVVGKVVGRGAVLAVALLVGFGVAAVVLLAVGDSFDAAEFFLFTLLTLFYGVTFVGAAVALSSVTGESSRAAAAALGFWIFDQFWGTAVLVVLVVTNDLSLPQPPYPEWYHVLSGLGPSAAYGNAAGYFLPPEFADQVQGQFGGLPAWYGLVVLLGWLVIPLVLGVLRFEQLDL